MAIMAVTENGVASSETTDLERSNDNQINGDKIVSKDQNLSFKSLNNNGVAVTHVLNDVVEEEKKNESHVDEEKMEKKDNVKEFGGNDHELVSENGGDGFKKEIRDLEEMLSKLNPMAKEFVPPSMSNFRYINGFGYVNNFLVQPNAAVNANAYPGRRRRNNFANGKKRMNSRTSLAQREEIIRRTVYVSDIDQQVTEEQLASLFINCGQVVDCRVCGDPNSVLRFAFIEFTDQEGAENALTLSGTMLGFYPVKVLPSKTAIAPVNPTFLPRSEDEREMCARTVYCTNIDKKVTQGDLKSFFETFCGEVHRLRMLGDYHHSTRIAFVEFIMAESAISALNCSGAFLGTLPIRVSPSKTPVRPRAPRSPSQ
ncbi:hypothetical protein RND81_05G107000 [Saponaria officinalis]|uniref:RRM domain-containing protein n=1 Tax=Saponaria officinalis TaxID=3572 RepID=A0AAW1KWN1_SAPOF